MNFISRRVQWGLVAAGYAGFVVFAAASLYQRHLVELQDPVAASGGMAAFGDTLLHVFLGFLFLIPTALLVWMIAKSEAAYTAYARFLFGFSLSAPVCVVVLLFGEGHVPRSLSWFSMYRLLWTPVVLMGMGISRWIARFDGAKRLVSCAVLVEALTLGAMVAALLYRLRA